MARKKRLKNKPKKNARAIGAPRDNYIHGIAISGAHFRERITDSCSRPKSGKRRRFTTLKSHKEW